MGGSSDFVTNSYGESWDSKKKNHEPQFEKTRSRVWAFIIIFFFFYVTRQLIWRHRPKLFIYYSSLKLKYSPAIRLKYKKYHIKYICIFKQQPHKSHEQDILLKKSSNRSILFCVLRNRYHDLFCVFQGGFYASWTQDGEVTKSLWIAEPKLKTPSHTVKSTKKH